MSVGNDPTPSALAEFSIIEKAPALELASTRPTQGVWTVAGAARRAALDCCVGESSANRRPGRGVVMVRGEGIGKRLLSRMLFDVVVACWSGGFYEWRRADGSPFRTISPAPTRPFAIAAIGRKRVQGVPSTLRAHHAPACRRRRGASPHAGAFAAAHSERWLDPAFDDLSALAQMLSIPGFALQRGRDPRQPPVNDDEACTAPSRSANKRRQFELWRRAHARPSSFKAHHLAR